MCFSLLAISFEAKTQHEDYKYAKSGWFEYHIDTFKLYWVEECTIDAGSQCTTFQEVSDLTTHLFFKRQ